MAEYVDFRYMPLEGKITGKQVLKQTEDAINDLGQHVYEIDIDDEKIQEAIDTSNQAIETAEEALAVVTTNRAVWYNSVTELREAIIDNGIVAAIKGYAFAGDEGQAFYVVREKKSGDVDDGKTIIFLDAGNVAEIIANTGITNMFDFDEDGYLSQIVDGDISNQYGEKKRLASYDGQQEIVEAFNDVINASLDIKGNAESARNSAEIAKQASDSLIQYLDTRESITAPIVDPTLTISGAAADAKITGGIFTNNAINAVSFEAGSISDSNGSNVTNTSRIRSIRYIPPFAGILSSSASSGRFYVYAWENSTFKGGLTSNGFVVSSSSMQTTVNFYNLRNSYPTYDFKVVYLKSGGTVTTADLGELKLTNVLYDDPKVAELDSRVYVVESELSKNIVGAVSFEAGSISDSNGSNASSSSRIRTKNYVPPIAGVLTSSASSGRFYVYAWESNTFKGALTSTDTFVTGSSDMKTSVDFVSLRNNYPTYDFKVVYLKSGGNVTMADLGELTITNIIYSEYKEPIKLRFLFNNLGGFNMGVKENKMSTANALIKVEHYKEFYAEYQPDIFSLIEYPDATAYINKYIDSAGTVDPAVEIYNNICPYSSRLDHYSVIKSNYSILKDVVVGISTGYDYSMQGMFALIQLNNAIDVAVLSTFFAVNGTAENRAAQLNAAITFLNGYKYAIIGVDMNCLSQEEFNTMKTTLETAGYKLANGGYFGAKETCPGATFKVIDNICVKGNIKILSAIVPDVYNSLSSDHLPVVADLLLY